MAEITLSESDVQRIAAAIIDGLRQHPQKQVYTPQEVAEKLGVSVQTVRRRIAAGEFGETLDDGKMHRVTEAGLQQYIDNHTGAREISSPEPPHPMRGRRVHANPGRI